jgi:hypothetical protein
VKDVDVRDIGVLSTPFFERLCAGMTAIVIFMSRKAIAYSPGEIGRVRVVKDFLPPPADLVPREDNVKVTLSLSRRSLDFFKREAKKRRVPYQRMIRALVDRYAQRQAGGKQ